MKRSRLRRRYGHAGRRKVHYGPPKPVHVYDIVCSTPSNYRWFRRAASEAGYGREIPGGGWILYDEPDKLPRFWETLDAAGGKLYRHAPGGN